MRYRLAHIFSFGVLLGFFPCTYAPAETAPAPASAPSDADRTPAAVKVKEDGSFTSSSVTLAPDPDDVSDASITARLKRQAVLHYLQDMLGDRLSSHLSAITPDLIERFVMQHSAPTRNAQTKEVLLTGVLDVDAIRRWARETMVKSVGSASLRPVWIFSSQIPGLTFYPRETAAKTRDFSLAGALFSQLAVPFREYNARLTPLADTGFAMTQPPRRESDVRVLRDQLSGAGYSAALWVHLSANPGGGTKIEYRFYNLSSARQLLAKTERLSLEAKDFAIPDRVKALVKEPTKEFAQDFKELVSTGVLFANVYHLVVDGLLVTAYPQFEAALGKQEFIAHESVKRIDGVQAEFELFSPLNLNDLTNRIRSVRYAGIALQVTGTASGEVPVIRASVVVRR